MKQQVLATHTASKMIGREADHSLLCPSRFVSLFGHLTHDDVSKASHLRRVTLHRSHILSHQHITLWSPYA